MQRGDLLGGDAQYQQGIVDFHHHHALALPDLATGAQVEQLVVARLRGEAQPAEQPTGQQDQQQNAAERAADLHQHRTGRQGRRGGLLGTLDGNGRRNGHQRLSRRMRSDGGDDVGDAHAELVGHHHHFTLCDQVTVDQDVQRLAGQTVQRHHRALRQAQQLFDGHLGAPQFHGQLDRNIQDQVDILQAAERILSFQRLEHPFGARAGFLCRLLLVKRISPQIVYGFLSFARRLLRITHWAVPHSEHSK